MISTNEFKNGMHISLDGMVYRIVEFQHVKPGKGGAFVRTKLKALTTGGVVDKTFRAGEKMQRMRTETTNVSYLYNDGTDVVLMDTESFEQIPLPVESLADELQFMRETTPCSFCWSTVSRPRSSCPRPSNSKSPPPSPA